MKHIFKRIIQILLILLLFAAITLWCYKNIVYPRKYRDIVEQATTIYNVDPNLVYAIIKKESKFNLNATSHSGAKGLMQIMDATARDTVKKIDSIPNVDYNIYDSYTNIFIGTKYISYLINHFDGNYYLAIAAYNAGMGNVKSWLVKDYIEYTTFNSVYDSIQYSETKEYLTDVINNYNWYTKLYN